MMSAWMTSAFGNPASVSERIGISSGSISTATTCRARSARYWVSVPMPGPISRTQSPGSMQAESAILPSTLVSIRKFCPNFFRNRKSYFLMISMVFCGFPSSGIFFSQLLLFVYGICRPGFARAGSSIRLFQSASFGKHRRAFSRVMSMTSCLEIPRSSATASATSGRNSEEFRCPRWGTGAR